MGTPWEHHGTIMGVPWEHHRSTMGAPWEYHGSTMGAPWEHQGSTMGAPQEHHGSIMGASWEHHGRIMGASWKHHGLGTPNFGIQHLMPLDADSTTAFFMCPSLVPMNATVKSPVDVAVTAVSRASNVNTGV